MVRQRRLKDYDELTFSDDFMFGKVMEDRDLCRRIIECLLQRPIGEIIECQTQREFHYTSDGKPIRLDVYNEDRDHNVYDTEMQNLGNKSIGELELPRRTRFYQSAMDVDYMNAGQSYKSLPDSNIMFICTFDPYGRGLSRYTFTARCKEESDIILNDGTTKVFYNATYEGDDIPEDLKNLYRYIRTGIAVGDLSERINEAVIKCRKNEVWRTQYMKEWIIMMDEREDGRKEGREEILISLVCKKLKKNKTPEQMADELETDIEEIKKIYDVAKEFAPEYDEDEIFMKMHPEIEFVD